MFFPKYQKAEKKLIYCVFQVAEFDWDSKTQGKMTILFMSF